MNIAIKEVVVEAMPGMTSVQALVEAARLAFGEMRVVRLIFNDGEFVIDPAGILKSLRPEKSK